MDSNRIFKKNARISALKGSSAVPQKLQSKSAGMERPSSLNLNSVTHPGLLYMDDMEDNNAVDDAKLSHSYRKEKATSIENIESRPSTKRIRDINSPTKSLQFEDYRDFNSPRRSSLCILALKAATAAARSSPNFISNTSEHSSLSSMISLPGVPPVQGVNDVCQVQLHRQKSKKANNKIINCSPRIQSEEDLILNMQRKQEFKAMNQAKLKEESDILHNIRKREMIDKINKGSGGVEKREKEEKMKIHQKFDIASGLMKTRNLLLAPIDTIIDKHDEFSGPPESDHPNQRRIVRRVVNGTVHVPPELVVQAETRFGDSIFVQECLEWHNRFRRRHLAPDLILDAPVS